MGIGESRISGDCAFTPGDIPALAGGVAVGLATFNAFGRNQIALGNGVAVRDRHVCHKARHRRHDHHRNARSTNFRSPTAHFLGKAGNDHRHVVAFVRREGGTREIPHGHASMRTRADEGRADMAPRHRPAPNRR